ncbi:EamA family transporter, partial [Acinetobacter baumannii]
RAVHDAVPLPALAFLRWSLCVAVLLPIAWPRLRRERGLIRQVPGLLFLLGLTGIALFSLGLFAAAYLSSATTASLVNAVVPFAIILLGPAFGA